jgi:hypothetical protein
MKITVDYRPQVELFEICIEEQCCLKTLMGVAESMAEG